jgi:hypothetical protein
MSPHVGLTCAAVPILVLGKRDADIGVLETEVRG